MWFGIQTHFWAMYKYHGPRSRERMKTNPVCLLKTQKVPFFSSGGKCVSFFHFLSLCRPIWQAKIPTDLPHPRLTTVSLTLSDTDQLELIKLIPVSGMWLRAEKGTTKWLQKQALPYNTLHANTQLNNKSISKHKCLFILHHPFYEQLSSDAKR